jgi:hypothetical protein
MAAKDDLAFEQAPHPNDTSRTGIFLRNTNASRGIIASVEVTAGISITLRDGDDSASFQRWPLSFELRIPPGSLALCGFETFYGRQPLSVPRAPVKGKHTKQVYRVLGAYYHNLPLPADPSDASRLVQFYTVYGDDQVRDFVVNLHPNRVISFDYEIIGETIEATASVDPGGQLKVWGKDSTNTSRFILSNVAFVN